MNEYDSILKEKKKYTEEKFEKKEKTFPWFQIDILCLTILLIIGYTIYFINILSPEKIFMNDISKLINKYNSVITHLELPSLESETYSYEGNINLEEKKYNFEINKSNQEMNFALSDDANKLTCYNFNNNNFINLSSFKEEYTIIKSNNYPSLTNDIKKNIKKELSKDKFIKKFYLNGTTPTVESNLILRNEDLIKLFKLNNIKDSYELLFTFKNNAITNEIINMKITINNLTNNKRRALLYENNYLTYVDDNNTYDLKLEKENENFILRIYKNETLYSVLTGTNKENSYQYAYQIIDEIYNINLNIRKDELTYIYDIENNINKDEVINNKKISINIKKSESLSIKKPDTNKVINYKEFSKEEKDNYKKNIDNIINPLRNFIKEYQ